MGERRNKLSFLNNFLNASVIVFVPGQLYFIMPYIWQVFCFAGIVIYNFSVVCCSIFLIINILFLSGTVDYSCRYIRNRPVSYIWI